MAACSAVPALTTVTAQSRPSHHGKLEMVPPHPYLGQMHVSSSFLCLSNQYKRLLWNLLEAWVSNWITCEVEMEAEEEKQ